MLLGLDLGTTNIKAVLTSESGEVLARGSAPAGLYHVGEAGVEQDIDEIWQAVLSAIAAVGARHDLRAVRAVGVSAQGATLQPLDAAGNPVGRAINWLDGRGLPLCEELARELPEEWFAQHTGHGEPGISVGQLLWLRAQSPDLLAPPARIGFVGDVIVGRLTGEAAHDWTSLCITGLYNPYAGVPEAALLERLGLREEQLPLMRSACSDPAGLVAKTADQTGLRVGIPVSPAVHDQYAATLGTGAVNVGDVNVGTGTAWVLLAMGDALAPPATAGAYACTHLDPSLSGQMLPLGNGGSAFAWARDLLGLTERSAQEIDALVESVPAGCDGLRCWPYLSPWTPPGLAPGLAGKFTGLRLGHGCGHVLRAVLEGLALELARNLASLAPLGVVGRLVMTGRAADSRVTPQLVADACDLPVACSAERDTSALGAAVVARALADPGRSLAELSREMAPVPKLVRPGPDAPLYRRLLDDFARLAR